MVCDERELPLDEFESAMLSELLAAQRDLGSADGEFGHKLAVVANVSGPRHHRLLVAAAALVAAVVMLAVVLPSNRANPRQSGPPVVAPHRAQTIRFEVAGYTRTEAAAASSKCLSAAGATHEAGAALRATVGDSTGTTLVVTTGSGWYTCNESPDGSTLIVNAFESYVQAEGGGTNANDLWAHWLMDPVELFSEGGGYLSKATMASGWLDTAVGRVAPNITKVIVQMPGGSMVAAGVENGFFVARQLLPSEPAFIQPPVGTPTPVLGYDSTGTLVYNSLKRPPLALCYVTPSGQVLTPDVTSAQKCQTAIAWGY